MTNVTSLYGKRVQVLLFLGWQKNAVGILQRSDLGSDCCMIMPLKKDDPLQKKLPTGSVGSPLHVNVYDITGIFELTQTIDTTEKTNT